MKVLVTHPGASLYGSDRMVLESVRGLLEVGADVVLTVPATGPLTEQAAALGARVVTCPVPVLRKSALRPAGAVRLAGQTATAARRAWSLLRGERPDVVYVSTVTTPSWLVLARAARVPAVCHVHEAESSAPAVLQRLLAAPLRSAAALVVNSGFALDVLLSAAPGLRGRARVLRNGVEGPPAPPLPLRPGPRGGAGDEQLRLLYLGRVSERKGVHVALAALELLLAAGVDAHLDVVGDVFADHAEFGQRLREWAQRPGLRERVVLHGFASDVWGHLSRSDVLLVPSVLPEPFGNTAVEGVLAARPVVASAVGGLPEALEGFRSARLVAAGDAEALAEGVRAVLADFSTAAQDAAQDAVRAAERYDPAGYRRGVAEVVSAVAGGDR